MKLKDTFKVAGQVVHVEINTNRDGKSKGNGTCQFKTPLEAINAVSLFHGQMLFNRPMVVRMDKDAPTQVDPSLLKLSMRLNSLVKSGAVHFDPGALPRREEPIPIAHYDRGFPSHSLPPPPSSSSAIMREKQFQEELADLQRRQRERNEMEIEMLKRHYFGDGGGGGDSLGGPDTQSRDLLEKERRIGELRAELYRFDNSLEMGRSSLDMLGGSGSQRFERGRLSPDPLTMGAHHSSLPPPVAREELLSRHYDMPPSRMMGGGDFDREPSLLDQVMSERQRGGWRIEEPIPPRFEEPAESGGGRRVFIRNLPWSTTSRHLKNFFYRAIGPVTFAEVMMHTDGRSKGVGVVEFASRSLAKQAISEYNGKNLGGREVEISEDKYE
ncbi:myelin expression factor 2-like [Dysidea avara]|uniref:myelin expression factor 2-like n=1 Tax=Dysidea avara TaxID=196820 RepID=UPI003330E7EB